MKKISLLLFLILLNCHVVIHAKNQTVSGSVKDDKNNPLKEVSVSDSDNSFICLTDAAGRFSISLSGSSESIIFRREGYKEKSISLNQDSVIDLNVLMDPVIKLGYWTKPATEVISSVSVIDGRQTDKPLVSIIGSLYGLLPGLGIMQNSGEVDKANYNFYIRGTATSTNYNDASGSARNVLTLVDGLPTDISLIDPNEIESISVLKDAAATSIYGMRGANGVILITTKRGIAQKTRVSFSAQTALQTPTAIHKPLDAVQYATLYNEAYLNDGNAAPFYDDAAIQNYRSGEDIYRYPNVNWYDEVVKDYSQLSRYNLNLNGGIENAKYFVSVGYLTENGIFSPDKAVNTYSTNNSFDRYTFRMNLDLKVTRTTNVLLSFNGIFDNKIAAGNADATSIFQSLLNTTPNAFPKLQADGIMLGGDNVHSNPYALLNRRAYSNNTVRFFQTSARFDQNLNFILPGLKAKVTYAFDSYAKTYINRSKTYASYFLKPDGTYTKYGTDGMMASAASYSNGIRNENFELGLDYTKSFGQHKIHGFLTYYYYKYDNSGYIPNKNLGALGNLSYSFNDKYLGEISFNYSGTEQFPEGDRFGFFPSVAAGWIVSNESFLKENNIVSFLKLRTSYGLRGNDRGLPYFAAIPQYLMGSGTLIGYPAASQQGFYENLAANVGITWEKSKMLNAGFDARLFKDRISIGFDYFTEERTDVLYPYGSATGTLGIDYPSLNLGIIENKGFELQAIFQENVGKLNFYAGGSISAARNKIVFMDEETRAEPYMYRTGGRLNQTFGLVSDGFFASDEEIFTSPAQFGTLKPGDIKYKDLNGDNVINLDDVTAIGQPTIPEMFYNASMGLEFRGLDLNVLFQGVNNVSKRLSNGIAFAFYNRGNVFEEHLGRWTPGTAATATYPRLSTTTNTNNEQLSDFWLKDGSYLRLKSIELGYTGSPAILKHLAIQSFRVFVSSYNPVTWSKIEIIDPELPGDAAYYPVARAFNMGITLNF